RRRSVERTFALRPVEAAEMATAERDPDYALGVDVAAADAVIGFWHVVDFRQRGGRRVRSRIDPHHRGLPAEHADGAPDRTVDWVRHPRIEARATGDAFVLGGIDRLIGLDIVVTFAVAIGVEHERGPALRLGGIAGLVEQFGVDPAEHRPAAAGPQRVVLV